MTHACTLDTKLFIGIGFEVKGLGLRYTRTQEERMLACVRDINISINWNTYSSLGMLMRVSAEYVGGLSPYAHVCDNKALKLNRFVAS